MFGFVTGRGGGGNAYPPDTSGAVGTTQYVQMVNSAFSVYRKSDGVRLAGPKTLNSLYGSGPCRNRNDGEEKRKVQLWRWERRGEVLRGWRNVKRLIESS